MITKIGFPRKRLSSFSVFLVMGFVFSSLTAAGQSDSLTSRWSFELSAGIAEHDKRLYFFPPRERLLSSQPEFFGTYSVGLALQYQLAERGPLSYSVGLNHIYDVATFERPVVDIALPPGSFVPSIVIYTDRYKQLMVAPFAQVSYRRNKLLSFDFRLQPRFRYWVRPEDTSIPAKRKGNLSISPRSLESYIGMRLSFGKVGLGLQYRIININHIDAYIVNGVTHGANAPERAPRGYEWFNPVKFTMVASYRL